MGDRARLGGSSSSSALLLSEVGTAFGSASLRDSAATVAIGDGTAGPGSTERSAEACRGRSCGGASIDGMPPPRRCSRRPRRAVSTCGTSCLISSSTCGERVAGGEGEGIAGWGGAGSAMRGEAERARISVVGRATRRLCGPRLAVLRSLRNTACDSLRTARSFALKLLLRAPADRRDTLPQRQGGAPDARKHKAHT